MISYYDIRAAGMAMRSLQNTPLRRRNLDIHFSIPKVLFLSIILCLSLVAASNVGYVPCRTIHLRRI